MKKTTTNAQLSFFASLRKTTMVFKPIMTACDVLEHSSDGRKAIISLSGKIRIDLIKRGQALISGNLYNGQSLVSSYTNNPEVIANFLNNDIAKLGGIR